jgi:hypothetical protein
MAGRPKSVLDGINQQFYITQPIRQGLRKLAYEEDRTLSDLAREALVKYLVQKGVLSEWGKEID